MPRSAAACVSPLLAPLTFALVLVPVPVLVLVPVLALALVLRVLLLVLVRVLPVLLANLPARCVVPCRFRRGDARSQDAPPSRLGINPRDSVPSTSPEP